MRAAAVQPTAPELAPDLPDGRTEALAHDLRLSEMRLAGAKLSDQVARGVTFRAMSIFDVDLSGSRLEHMRILDTVIEQCNLANIHARGASLDRVLIRNCRLTGIELAESSLADVVFENCRMDLASLRACRLARVRFDDCMLAQTDFLDAQLESVRLDDCDLSGGDLRGARMRHCELRRVELSGLHGVQSLRGAAMDWSDILASAGVLAAALARILQ
jgi:uncharacterized protein YjbI with pentapeptide repeats